MTNILNAISIISTLIVFTGLIYIVLNFIFGRISVLNKVVIAENIKAKHLLFYAIALFLILKFGTFYLPYSN